MQALFTRAWNDVYDPGRSPKAAILQEFHFRPPVAYQTIKLNMKKKQTLSKNSKQTHLCENMTSF